MGEKAKDGEGRIQEGPFDHERLDVYQVAIRFIEWRSQILRRYPAKHYLVDQLDRALTSVAANIAEGSGEKPGAERGRFIRYAKRSATECSALLDVVDARKLEPSGTMAEGRLLIHRVIAMLTALGRANGAF